MTEETGNQDVQGWREATESALYGPDGFYKHSSPSAHFRTSVHASTLFATAVTGLLVATARALGTKEVSFVDVGAGRGELARAVLDSAPPTLTVHACAVERAPRPEGLDPGIEWRSDLPADVTGLLFANEWLDNVPVDVAETDENGTVRYVLVHRDGTEELGEPVSGRDAEWLARWWPLDAAGTRGSGTRAEIGHPRDEAWARAVASLTRGLAVAVDYGHTRATRPAFGTLTSFREGQEVRPIPDGTRDLTSHVSLDSLDPLARVGMHAADAMHTAHTAETDGPRIMRQREALRALGVSGERPPLPLATTNPTAYVRALAGAAEAAELTAAGGLGDFAWVMHPKGMRLADVGMGEVGRGG